MTDTRLAAALLRSSITGMATRYADAQGDFMMYAALAHAYPAGQSAARAEKAQRARDRRRKALARLTAALAELATKGA